LVSAVSEGIQRSPISENHLDIQEAYADFVAGPGRLRVGRQELQFGSQRFIGTRDGTNVRRTWDGVKYAMAVKSWSIDALYAREVQVDPRGVFNDDSGTGRSLAGIYATGNVGASGIDTYYLWSRRNDRATIEGVANQRRHTIGLRSFGNHGAWFWNWEAAYQFGDHGSDAIRAWTLASNTGYRPAMRWRPSFMLSANISSGDSQRKDGKLETFDALYPRGNYFSEIAQLGPSNFFNLNPYLTLEPANDLAISMDINWFWRTELNDGVYGPPGNIVRLPRTSRERRVSTAFSASIDWNVSRRTMLGFVTTYSQADEFLQDTGSADNTWFAELTLKIEL
jgi:hypothetical protein